MLRSLLLFLSLLVLSLGGPAAADGEVYPSDQCVSDKLEAAAASCKRAFRAWAGYERRHSWPERRDRLVAAQDLLAGAWDQAEQTSADAGVSCEEVSVDTEAMSKVFQRGARRFARALEAEGQDGRCGSRLLRAAGRACRNVIGAVGAHIESRTNGDRDGALRDAAVADAFGAFREDWNDLEEDGCEAGLDGDAAQARLQDLADEAVIAATVAPDVPEEWTQYDPPAQVQYGDKLLEPICSSGTPYVYFARRGTVNKLVVYYQGGGACWNQPTCGGVPEVGLGPVFGTHADESDNPGLFQSGFNDFTNAENPFKDWHAVFISYCTGDVHWGDAVVNHTLGQRETLIHHKGFVNAQVVEKWTREHFAYPEQVFVTGSSAGAYGAIVNSLTLQQNVYPSSDFAVLGDAGNGVITDEFLENDLVKWGIEENLPDFIPALDVDITELNAADLWVESALFFDRGRFANFSTAYDGSSGGQSGFYHIMRAVNVFDWPNWQNSACEWNEQMRGLAFDAAGRADNYRYYIGTGSAHTTWGRNRNYTDTTGGVPTVADWVRAMVEDTEDWENVECEDCGTLLDGDPQPNPLSGPFVDVGEGEVKIVCEEPEL